MRTWLSAMLAAAVLVAWAAAPAEAAKGKKGMKTPEQAFKKRDRDGDGQVSLQEFQGKKATAKAETRFRKRDKDGNGKLALAEFKGRGRKKKAS